MGRGWESKSVEAQQDEALARAAPQRPPLTREEAARHREQETLRLSLQSVVHQLDNCRDARRRDALEQAVADLQHRIRELSGD